MPWSDNNRGGLHGPTVWRILIVGLAIVLALVVVGVVTLFKSNRSAIDSTHELSCRIGAFFVGQPIVQQPGQTEADFRQTIRKAISFLRALRSEDCTDVQGASITAQQITRELHHLHEAVPEGGGASGGGPPPGGKPGPPPGGPPPTPKPHCTVEVNALGQHVCVEAP